MNEGGKDSLKAEPLWRQLTNAITERVEKEGVLRQLTEKDRAAGISESRFLILQSPSEVNRETLTLTYETREDRSYGTTHSVNCKSQVTLPSIGGVLFTAFDYGFSPEIMEDPNKYKSSPGRGLILDSEHLTRALIDNLRTWTVHPV